MSAPLLEIVNVSKTFVTGAHEVVALNDISLDVRAGECLAIVGESGSGKSTLANLLLGIHSLSAGEIRLNGKVLLQKRDLKLRRLIQLVQQNPLSSLNPKRSIGASLRLALDVHDFGEKAGRWDRVGELLEEVGLESDMASRVPASLSGGQRQRVAIARALACVPDIIVLDEPTSALDVLVQARVLRLLDALRSKRNLTFVFITHDLAVVRNIADRVAVLERGQLVELADTASIFSKPSHAYTRRLIGAIPVVDAEEEALRAKFLGENDVS